MEPKEENEFINSLKKKLVETVSASVSQPKVTDVRGMLESLKQPEMVETILGGLLKTKDFVNGFKYTEAELINIEELLNKNFPKGHEPLATTLIPFGFYLGEFFIRKFDNAKWVIDDEDNKDMNNIFNASVEFDGLNKARMQVRPFLRVDKFWKNREDKMTALYRVMSFTSEVNMNPEYWSKRADKDGWIQMASGDMLRMYIGEKKKGAKISDNMDNAKGAFHDGTFKDDKQR